MSIYLTNALDFVTLIGFRGFHGFRFLDRPHFFNFRRPQFFLVVVVFIINDIYVQR